MNALEHVIFTLRNSDHARSTGEQLAGILERAGKKAGDLEDETGDTFVWREVNRLLQLPVPRSWR